MSLTGTRYDIDLFILVNTQREKILIELSAIRSGLYLTRKTSLVCHRAGRKLNAVRVVSRRSFSSLQQVFADLLPQETGATRFRPRMQTFFVLKSGHSSAIVAVKQANLVRLVRFAPRWTRFRSAIDETKCSSESCLRMKKGRRLHVGDRTVA